MRAYSVGVPSWTQRGTISNPHFLWLQKLPRSAAAAQQQQHRYNTSESRNAHIHRNACAPPFQHTTCGISSHPHPEGEPCNTLLYKLMQWYDMNWCSDDIWIDAVTISYQQSRNITLACYAVILAISRYDPDVTWYHTRHHVMWHDAASYKEPHDTACKWYKRPRDSDILRSNTIPGTGMIQQQ